MRLAFATADYVAALSGWRRLLAALLLGALAVLAMAPTFYLPLLIVSYIGLAWLERGCQRAWASFATGWAFGLGFHAAGLHWIYHAYLVPPADFAAFGAPSVLGLAAVLAIYHGLALAGVRFVLRWQPRWSAGAARALLLALLLGLAEFLRTYLFTGFPWNQPSQALLAWLPLVQAASLIGAHGLNLAVLAVATLLAYAATRQASQRAGALLGALAICGLLAVGGGARLALADRQAVVPDTYLRLVQPNINQDLKWLIEQREKNFASLLRLSTLPADKKLTLVIWPETALTFPLERFPAYVQLIGQAAPPGSYVLTGVPRQDGAHIYNSLLAIDSKGAVAGIYDKAHLVPFGEYVPLNDVLGLGDTIGRGSFSAGPGPRTLALPGLAPFAPLICYEAIFPGEAGGGAARPSWLLNVTNDAWFGNSIGPHQHLAAARMRAVEQGLPLIRVANTGISAVIDAYGGELARLGLDKTGIIDNGLPVALSGTLYARWGDWIFLLIAILIIALIQRAARNRPN